MFFPLNVVHNREDVGWVRGGGKNYNRNFIFSQKKIFFSGH